MQARRAEAIRARDRSPSCGRWNIHGCIGRDLHHTPPSYPAGWSLLAMDRIWAEPPESLIETRAWKSGLSRLASDHLPVRALLRFQANSADR